MPVSALFRDAPYCRLLAIALSLMNAPLPAQPAQRTYGQALLARILDRHPDLASIDIAIDASDGSAGPAFSVGHPASGKKIRSVLRRSTGNPIGIVIITMRPSGATASSARHVAAVLGRYIYLARGLGEPDPYIPGAAGAPYAQSLIAHAIDADPALITLAMHVTPIGGTDNIVIASNFGRIGKPADADDLRVIATMQPIREITDGGKRMAVELPLLDRRGRVIGALSTSFAITPDRNADAVFERAVALRNRLARHIASPAALTVGARQGYIENFVPAS